MKRLLLPLLGICIAGASHAAPPVPESAPKQQQNHGQSAYPLVPRLTQEEYEGTLAHWRTRYPGTFTFQKRGESPEGFAFYLAKATGTFTITNRLPCLPTGDLSLVFTLKLTSLVSPDLPGPDEEPAKAAGVSLQLLHPGGPPTEDDSIESFLIRHLADR